MRSTLIGGGATVPNKFAPLATDDGSEEAGARRGQIMVMFALFMIAMMGMLGLAVDGGHSLAAKRAVQGAADAGALAGARMIARYTPAAPTSALPEVTTIVQQNTFGPVTPTIFACQYIGNNWQVVGTCDQTVPASAAGARVRTRATVDTWFIRVIPGAPQTVTVAGYAKARVEVAQRNPSDGPFIVCGFNTWDVTSDPSGSGPAVGTSMDLLAAASPARINQAAIGQIFRIHDANLDLKANADCSSRDNRFKGLADQTRNGGETAGSWFNYTTTTVAGPTQTKVDGADGCAPGVPAPYDCVMILPIATNNPAETGNDNQLYVVGFAAFYVTTVDTTTHNGQLLDDYILSGPGTSSWCRDCGGTVVIPLIW